jgi:hypothetical protein
MIDAGAGLLIRTNSEDGMIMTVCGQDGLCQDGEIRLYSTVTEKLLFDGVHFFRAQVSRLASEGHFDFNFKQKKESHAR